jgi:hypothetical protein
VNFCLTFNPESPFLILCNTSLRKVFNEIITSFLKTSVEMECIKFRNIGLKITFKLNVPFYLSTLQLNINFNPFEKIKRKSNVVNFG